MRIPGFWKREQASWARDANKRNGRRSYRGGPANKIARFLKPQAVDSSVVLEVRFQNNKHINPKPDLTMSNVIASTDALRTRFELFSVNSVGLTEPKITPQPQIDPATNSARLLRELSESTVSSRNASIERIVSGFFVAASILTVATCLAQLAHLL
jgi:hypothetical protein